MGIFNFKKTGIFFCPFCGSERKWEREKDWTYNEPCNCGLKDLDFLGMKLVYDPVENNLAAKLASKAFYKKRCPCGWHFSDDYNYCKYCGSKLIT